jgi:hypothetical protein
VNKYRTEHADDAGPRRIRATEWYSNSRTASRSTDRLTANRSSKAASEPITDPTSQPAAVISANNLRGAKSRPAAVTWPFAYGLERS